MADPDTQDGKTNCGFVALIGAPNAGKSTLLNCLVGRRSASSRTKLDDAAEPPRIAIQK
jgi:GTP-binding protein Era